MWQSRVNLCFQYLDVTHLSGTKCNYAFALTIDQPCVMAWRSAPRSSEHIALQHLCEFPHMSTTLLALSQYFVLVI